MVCLVGVTLRASLSFPLTCPAPTPHLPLLWWYGPPRHTTSEHALPGQTGGMASGTEGRVDPWDSQPVKATLCEGQWGQSQADRCEA